MSVNTTTTGFSMYNPRRLSRTVYNGFQGCGIDVFTNPTDQNPVAYHVLNNVMPTTSGGFVRRWGLNLASSIKQIPSQASYKRLFSYTAKKDVTNAGTADTSAILGTDDTETFMLYQEPNSGVPAAQFSLTFGTTGEVHALTSRSWFYLCNGSQTGIKANPSQRSSTTLRDWGIITPVGNNAYTASDLEYLLLSGVGTAVAPVSGTGQNCSTSPVVSISGGGGSGASATATVIEGVIVRIVMSSGGSGYTSVPTVSVTDSTGTGIGSFLAIVDFDSTSTTYKQVIAITLNGPMVFSRGRRYAIAYKDSLTGHTSDLIYSYGTYGAELPLPSIGDNASSSFQEYQNGIDLIGLKIILLAPHDNYADTVVLMATADGGDVTTLYGITEIPLSSFTAGTYVFYDTIPDTVTDETYTGAMLLNNNIYVEPDGLGGSIGISGNTPPPKDLNKPILHKGRLFGTNGKTLYYSKSLQEVTTSTGLITSKWEEAWPGYNQIDLAYGNETITGLLSDGDVLYIGTDENIYRLLGDSPSNFSVPATIFRGVGVASQDAWTVIYKDDIPAGYMWYTPDNKIMLSDFNTYTEIGKYVYPLLYTTGTLGQLQSTSYGPYSLAILSIQTTNNQPTYFIYDTKNSGWYFWQRPAISSTSQLPTTGLLSYTNSAGINNIYTCINQISNGVKSCSLMYFDPNRQTDMSTLFDPVQTITWAIETSWLNFDDDVSFFTLNDVEAWTPDEDVTATVSACNGQDFDNPFVVKTGPLVSGPLGTKKLFLAGCRSISRFFKLRLETNNLTDLATFNPVLSQFSFEHFPHTRL